MAPFDPQAFGARLCRFRQRANMTQSDLAELVGVAETQVWRWEAGLRVPQRDALIALADALALTLDELVGREL